MGPMDLVGAPPARRRQRRRPPSRSVPGSAGASASSSAGGLKASWGSVVPKVESKRRIVEKPSAWNTSTMLRIDGRETLCVSGWTQRGRSSLT